MGQSNTNFLAARPLPAGCLWLVPGVAWLSSIGAALLAQELLAIVLTGIGLAFAATLVLAPVRRAIGNERRKIAALLNAVPEGVLEINAAGEIVFVNPQLCEMFGYLPDELIGESVEMLVPQAARGTHAARRAAFWTSARSRPMGSGLDISGVRKDGSLIAVDVSLSRIETRHGTAMYCLVRDDSVRRAFEKQLLDSNRRLTSSVTTLERNALELETLTEMGELLHGSNTEAELRGIVAHTLERLLPDVTGALYVFGESRASAGLACSWGAQTRALRPAISSEDCWALRRGQIHCSGAAQGSLHCPHMRAGAGRAHLCIPLLGHGELLGVLLLIAAGNHPQALAPTSGLQFLQALANQIALSSANLRLRETLRAQSTLDPLTGLHNRRALDQHFAELLQRARLDGGELSLLLVDIDHFKHYNDRLGHECGDIALRQLAQTLMRCVRENDVVCRLGGEEFVILLPHTALGDAGLVAEKLRRAVESASPRRNESPLPGFSVSIGAATLGPHCDTLAMLLRHADKALYRAKAAGRNRVALSSTIDQTGAHPLPARLPRQA